MFLPPVYRAQAVRKLLFGIARKLANIMYMWSGEMGRAYVMFRI